MAQKNIDEEYDGDTNALDSLKTGHRISKLDSLRSVLHSIDSQYSHHDRRYDSLRCKFTVMLFWLKCLICNEPLQKFLIKYMFQ